MKIPSSSAEPQVPPVLVAGIGNLLLQDDGFGPQAIAQLQAEYEFSPDVELLDLGTPALDFVDYLAGRNVVILLDALSCGGEPGAVITYRYEKLRENIPGMRLSAHQPCLQETIFAAETAGMKFREFQLVGIVGSSFDVGTDMSPAVKSAVPAAIEYVTSLVSELGYPCEKRPVPIPRKSWWD